MKLSKIPSEGAGSISAKNQGFLHVLYFLSAVSSNELTFC